MTNMRVTPLSPSQDMSNENGQIRDSTRTSREPLSQIKLNSRHSEEGGSKQPKEEGRLGTNTSKIPKATPSPSPPSSFTMAQQPRSSRRGDRSRTHSRIPTAAQALPEGFHMFSNPLATPEAMEVLMRANSTQQESGKPKEMRSIVNAFLRTGPSKLSPEPSRDYCIAAPRPNAISANERRKKELLPSVAAPAVPAVPSVEQPWYPDNADSKTPAVSKQAALFSSPFPHDQAPASVCSNVVDVKIEGDVFSPIPGDYGVLKMSNKDKSEKVVDANHHQHVHQHMSSNRDEVRQQSVDNVNSMLTVRDWTGFEEEVEEKEKSMLVFKEVDLPEPKANSPATKPKSSSQKKKATHLIERDNSPVAFVLPESESKKGDDGSQKKSSSFSFGMRGRNEGLIADPKDAPRMVEDHHREVQGTNLDRIDSADSVQQPNPFASMLNHLKNAGGPVSCPSPGLNHQLSQPCGQRSRCPQTVAAMVQTDSPRSPENQTPLRLLPEEQMIKETNYPSKTPEIGNGDVEAWIDRRGIRDKLNSPATADIRRMWSAVAERTRAQDEAAKAAAENDHLRQELQSVRDSLSRLFPNVEGPEALLTAADGHEWARAEVSRAREAAEYMMALADQIQATFSLCEQEKATLAEELEAAWASAQKASVEKSPEAQAEFDGKLGSSSLLVHEEQNRSLLLEENLSETTSRSDLPLVDTGGGGPLTTSMDLTVYNHHSESLILPESRPVNDVVMQQQLQLLQEDTRRLQAANDELRGMVLNIQDRLQVLEHRDEEKEKADGSYINVIHGGTGTSQENTSQVVDSIDFAKLREAVARAKGLVAVSLTSSPDGRVEHHAVNPETVQEEIPSPVGDEEASLTCNAVIDGVLFTNVPRGNAGLSQVKELVQYFETLHEPAAEEDARDEDDIMKPKSSDKESDVVEQDHHTTKLIERLTSTTERYRKAFLPTAGTNEEGTPPQYLNNSHALTPAPTPVDGMVPTPQRHHMDELELMGLLGCETRQNTPVTLQPDDSNTGLTPASPQQFFEDHDGNVNHPVEYTGALGEEVHARLHRLKHELQAARLKLSRVDRGLLAITSPSTRCIEAGETRSDLGIKPLPYGEEGGATAGTRVQGVSAADDRASVKIKVEEKEEEIGVVGPVRPVFPEPMEERPTSIVNDERSTAGPLSLEYYHSTRNGQAQELNQLERPKEEEPTSQTYQAATLSPAQATRWNEFLFDSSDEDADQENEYRSPSSSRIAMWGNSMHAENTLEKQTPVHARTHTVIASTAKRTTPESQESFGNARTAARGQYSLRGHRESRRPTDREEQEFRRRAAALKIHVSPYFKRQGHRSNEGQRDIMDTVL